MALVVEDVFGLTLLSVDRLYHWLNQLSVVLEQFLCFLTKPTSLLELAAFLYKAFARFCPRRLKAKRAKLA